MNLLPARNLLTIACASVALATATSAQTRLLRFDPLPAGSSVNKVPVAGVGDLDRDGVPDLAIGRPTLNNYRGAVLLESGRNGALLAQFDGDPSQQASFGFSTASLGDIDSDGYVDLAIGAVRYGTASAAPGAVYVYSGRTRTLRAVLVGDGEGDLFGSAIASVGDLDGDGVPDFVVGAPENGAPIGFYGAGYVKVFSGRTLAMLYRREGTHVADEYGSSIAGVGDVDHDGAADFMVGALLERNTTSGQGSARVYSGASGSVLRAYFGEPGSDHFGVAVGSPGDVDGDGIRDFVVGAISMTNPLPGKVWVYSGSNGSRIGTVIGPAGSGVFGLRIAPAGDVDQDGFADFWVSDPMDAATGPGLGAVHLVTGRQLKISFTMRGPNPGCGFGSTMASVDDLDRDGLPDLAIGVPGVTGVRGGVTSRLDVMSSARYVSTFGRGCSTTQIPTLDASLPILGTTLQVFLSTRALPSSGFCMLSRTPDLPTPLPYGCTLYIDQPTMAIVANFTTDAAGRWFGAFPLPSDPNLVGVQLAMQAMIVATAGFQLYDTTNAVYLSPTLHP
ncbi:MAG: integrin alpha [Planctomycetota bacterium]